MEDESSSATVLVLIVFKLTYMNGFSRREDSSFLCKPFLRSEENPEDKSIFDILGPATICEAGEDESTP